jgi:hypothetical protein
MCPIQSAGERVPKDTAFIDRFTSHDPDRRRVREVIEASGFTIERVIQPGSARAGSRDAGLSERTWGLVLRMSLALQELFGRRSEILLLCADYATFQSRTIQEAQALLGEYRPRLSEDFAIIVSASRTADRDVREATERLNTDTVFVGVPMHRLGSLAPHGPDTLTSLLQARVYSRDLYQITGAVTDPQRFFGRQTLINELEAALRLKGHVGLFGLRKMGKTSLLYRILEKLRGHPSVLAAHVDAQRIDAINRSAAYFLWSLGEALFDSNKRIHSNKKLRLFGKYAMFIDVPEDVRATIGEFFHHDVGCILEKGDRRIVFLIDEIERMWPGVAGGSAAGGWGQAFVEVWRLLRGIEQESAGRISYFVTGTSPECLEASRAAGEENPLHRYIERRFLPHLDDVSRRELLTRIGDRIGVKWSDPAIQFVVSQVSGHPSLLRTMGSFVHRSLIDRKGPVTVDEPLARDLFRRALPELNASFRQITEALRDSYKDDFMLLELLANGRIGEYRQYASSFPDALVHLEGYELVDTEQSRIPLEALQTFLQKQNRDSKAARAPAQGLEQGDTFEGYEIQQKVSAGGFGDVYKVRASTAALKVFQKSSFEQLLREVEALEDVAHPNVLRILAYDKTADDRVYLVSEFLEGDTLERCCAKSFRQSDAEAEDVLRALLGALDSFHPNVKRLTELRAKDELTPEEADDLSRARAGYVHRDIKPANVILVQGRGPVLIDFGIASRISTPVKTVSATPGYLPPDFDRSGWTPDVDLYQLGLTMLQTRLGVHYDGTAEGVGELRELLKKEVGVGTKLRDVLLEMTEPARGSRYESAAAVLTDLG